MCLNPYLNFEEKEIFNKFYYLFGFKNIKRFTKLEAIKEEQLNIINEYITNQKINVYGCGKCLECLQYKKYDWYKRCEIEKKNWKYIYFITLTFDNQHYHYHKKDRFFSYWIKNNVSKYLGKNNFKYFAVGEYGSHTLRYHFHLLLFVNEYFELIEFKKSKRNNVLYVNEWLNNHWNYGFHSINLVDSPASFKYCVKYTNKQQNLKVFCSRGLGNFIYDFDTINFHDVPKSLLKNAYVRNWIAIKKYKLKEVDITYLNSVLKSNEKYLYLKSKLAKFNFNNNWVFDKYLSLKNLSNSFNTINIHRFNSKSDL